MNTYKAIKSKINSTKNIAHKTEFGVLEEAAAQKELAWAPSCPHGTPA